MNVEEFLKPRQDSESNDSERKPPEAITEVTEENKTEVDGAELDVQKAVVESLAADKAVQDELIESLKRDKLKLQSEIVTLRAKIEEQNIALGKVGETLSKNLETPLSNQICLLERSSNLDDRFEGESRDHVLEVLKTARDAAEKDGYLRKAQILEAVLVANEPNGQLEKKRTELTKLFNDNGNIVSGPVIEELQKMGITHKNGEEYLLPSEIIRRVY